MPYKILELFLLAYHYAIVISLFNQSAERFPAMIQCFRPTYPANDFRCFLYAGIGGILCDDSSNAMHI